jgi:hypothetical protein
VSLTIIKKTDLPDFIHRLSSEFRIGGPVEKNGGYAFNVIEDSSELRLDYPTTILPPKKFLLPTKETLFEFDKGGNGTVKVPPVEQKTVVFGVHTCDVHAIKLLDHVFATGHIDPYYTTRRKQTFIVSIECLNPCDEYSFCKSMGTLSTDDGYDLHMTDLGDFYAIDIGTDEGKNLLNYAKTKPATEEELKKLNAVISEKWSRFPYRLDFDVNDLPSLLNMSMKSPLWEELGERCLACAACTNVCPTSLYRDEMLKLILISTLVSGFAFGS